MIMMGLFRVTKNNIIISLPDVERYYRFFGLGFKKYISAPQKKPKEHIFDGEHYWEVGKKRYPLERICNDIISAGFSIERTYRVFENLYHRFFVLKKNYTVANKPLYTFSKWRLGDMEEWRNQFNEGSFNAKCIMKKLRKAIKIHE